MIINGLSLSLNTAGFESDLVAFKFESDAKADAPAAVADLATKLAAATDSAEVITRGSYGQKVPLTYNIAPNCKAIKLDGNNAATMVDITATAAKSASAEALSSVAGIVTADGKTKANLSFLYVHDGYKLDNNAITNIVLVEGTMLAAHSEPTVGIELNVTEERHELTVTADDIEESASRIRITGAATPTGAESGGYKTLQQSDVDRVTGAWEANGYAEVIKRAAGLITTNNISTDDLIVAISDVSNASTTVNPGVGENVSGTATVIRNYTLLTYTIARDRITELLTAAGVEAPSFIAIDAPTAIEADAPSKITVNVLKSSQVTPVTPQGGKKMTPVVNINIVDEPGTGVPTKNVYLDKSELSADIADGSITADKLASGVLPAAATTAAAGLVKKAEAQAKVTDTAAAAAGDAPTKAEFDALVALAAANKSTINALIDKLTAAGIM